MEVCVILVCKHVKLVSIHTLLLLLLLCVWGGSGVSVYCSWLQEVLYTSMQGQVNIWPKYTTELEISTEFRAIGMEMVGLDRVGKSVQARLVCLSVSSVFLRASVSFCCPNLG